MPDAMRNGDFSALLAGSNPIQLYDPQNNFAPYANNQGVPIVNPVAEYLFANPGLYPDCGAASPVTPKGGKCLPPLDGIAQNNYQAPTRSYKANDQGDAKDRVRSARFRQNHGVLFDVDGLRWIHRGAGHHLPGSQSLPNVDYWD